MSTKFDVMSDEELMCLSESMRIEGLKLREERKAICEELAFRGSQAAALKAMERLQKLNPSQLDRLKKLAQRVTPNPVLSAGKMGNVGE